MASSNYRSSARPDDAGLGQAIVTSERVPVRIREALNVESGLKEGGAVPFLLVFLALAAIQAIRPLLDDRSDEDPLFEYNSLVMWVKREKIPLTRIASHFALGDLRKFAEQYGDIIQWDQSNRAYIMTHSASGISWKHYKHPLPENVFDAYMEYWAEVRFEITRSFRSNKS